MKKAGLTLLEITIALVILGLVITASIQLYGSALQSAHAARDWTAATLWAEEGMELAKIDLNAATDRSPETLPDGFQRRVDVRVVDDRLAEVTVQVEFPQGGRFAVSRLVARR